MESNCPEINLAIKLIEDNGNKITEVSTGWSKVIKDIRIAEPLNIQLKEKIRSEIRVLRYWKYKGSPHNKPDEGFFCEKHGISITFPVIG